MRILVIGNGAREDALAWRLARSASCDAVFVAPGNAGTARRHENWPIAATDGKALVARAQAAKIDLAVIGPETAIAASVADRLRDGGIATFGPGRSAGRLESSKIFAKRFMERYGIPTASARVVHSLAAAEKALDDWKGPCVVKADGLAAGKGVVVADDAESGQAVVRAWYGTGGVPGGGDSILLEERLEGPEVSVFALGDGHKLVPFASACDYKRAGDGDTGPNTGGMGAYSPPSGFPEDLHEIVRGRILEPVAAGLAAEGESYVGVLYCGLMWTADGPAVIEFNVRFGDPEAQVIAPRVRGDFARLLESAAHGALDLEAASLGDDACVGVVLATGDYPKTSTPLGGLPANFDLDDRRMIFWGASTLRADGLVDAKGGRVMTVAALGSSVAEAHDEVYRTLADLSEPLGIGRHLRCRTDIAAVPARASVA